ncbi:MAG: pcm 1 [Proteobacteria bacterium]|nr:pcm 1 [Pseudomonadota bacterium]
MRPFEPDKVAIAELTMKLRGMGVTDNRLLRALELVPRRMFVAAAHQASAYLDRSLPIECGQTINAPSTVALMVSALAVEPDDKVLEVGCGSGFQAAILAHLAAQVVTMDRFRSLIDIAEDRLSALKITNVTTLLGDGLEGFTRYAPYNRILIDGAVEKVPTALLDQLADKGTLVAPVGAGHTQTLVRISRDGRLFHRAELGSIRQFPLLAALNLCQRYCGLIIAVEVEQARPDDHE